MSRREIEAKVRDMRDQVGLQGGPALRRRYPHELSGGHRQRVEPASGAASGIGSSR